MLITSVRTLLLFTMLVAFAPSSSVSSAIFPPADVALTSIDISGLTSFLATLPADEKDEQLRDWAAYGLKNSRGLARNEEIPVRHPAFRDTRPGEVAPGRVVALSDKEWGVIVPRELLRDKPLIGGLIDKKYAELNLLPDRISVYTYSANPASTAIGISLDGSHDAREMFTPAYGYQVATVRSLSDFENFNRQIDDIVMAQTSAKGMILGGRKYSRDGRRALNVEEIASLYQAYNPPGHAESRAVYETRIRERYARMLKADGALRKSIGSGKVKKARVLSWIRRQDPFRPAGKEVNVGFSLDPARDYPAIARDLDTFADRLAAAQSGHTGSAASLAGNHAAEIHDAARRIRSGRNILPLLKLRKRYAETAATDFHVSGILEQIESTNSFQTARYDGSLQGTRAGMILFYTDLLAKLWVLDYQGIAPRGAIKGFRSAQEISVPKLYWADFQRNSQTRLWFGLKPEAFDVYGDKILFQPTATRVYAASSDPLSPGKESLPNFQSKEFLGWWDAHYQGVAEYEPYFHKLNQIQKWSCIFMVLKEKKSHLLDSLQQVPVTRTLDFENWLQESRLLKPGVEVAFLDKQRYGRSTECLPLLRSGGYLLMGKSYQLRGGVSLASRKDILAKMHKHDRPADSREAAVALHPGKGDRSAQPAVARVPEVASARQPEGAQQTRRTQRGAAPRQGRSAMQAKAAGEGEGEDGGRNEKLGRFSAEKKPGSLKLSWEKGPSIALHEYVAGLAALQESNGRENKGEAVFRGNPGVQSVVRVREGNTYLVKTKATGDDWIYLRVNPERPDGYSAKASGAFPEADIFCAKLVSAAYARELSAGKEVIR